MRERHFSLVLEYDGADFHGWQRQPRVRTVQGELERVLGRLLDREIRVRGAGRTDAGVHALRQWATFSAAVDRPLADLLRGLDALLPASLRVRELAESPRALDALRQSVRKTYCYQLHLGRSVPLVRRRTFAAVGEPIDLGLVRECARRLEGEHDFRSFVTEASRQPHCVRRLDRIRVLGLPSGLRLFFTAPGFLYNLVRALVGAVLAVGTGRWTLARLEQVLRERDRALGPALAPAHGLFLFRVDWSGEVADSLGRRRARAGFLGPRLFPLSHSPMP